MMNELAIDTAGAGCSAALRIGASDFPDVKFFSRYKDIRRGHAEHILSQVESLLSEAGIGYDSLNRISCTMGPGSFTGVRIGIAFAKGLALACDLPLYGVVCTLVAGQKLVHGSNIFLDQCAEVIAESIDQIHVSCVLEAGRDEFYVQVFSIADNFTVKVATEPLLLSYLDVSSFCEKHDLKVVFGSGAEKFSDICESNLSDKPLSQIPIKTLDMDVRAEDLLVLDDCYFKINEEVCPLYLRAPDAKPQLGKTLLRRL